MAHFTPENEELCPELTAGRGKRREERWQNKHEQKVI
jgi:hypothetical protein